jgi:hypothetical protein
MKKYLLLFLIIFLFVGCSINSNKNIKQNNAVDSTPNNTRRTNSPTNNPQNKELSSQEKYFKYLEGYDFLKNYSLLYKFKYVDYMMSDVDSIFIKITKNSDGIKNVYTYNLSDGKKSEYILSKKGVNATACMDYDSERYCDKIGQDKSLNSTVCLYKEGELESSCKEIDIDEHNEELLTGRLLTVDDLLLEDLIGERKEASNYKLIGEDMYNNEKCELYRVENDLQNLKKYFIIGSAFDNEYATTTKEVCFSKKNIPLYIKVKILDYTLFDFELSLNNL